VDHSSNEDYDTVMESEFLTPDVGVIIKRLWDEDKLVKNYWRKRDKLGISISGLGDYYMENVTRFADDDYVPNDEDILKSKRRTTGIIEIDLNWQGKKELTLIDVGGQRNERRKWIHLFDNVNAIIFFTAIDEYDMTLQEDENTNRMDESLILFERISKLPYFEHIPFVLFFNKFDSFKKKIKKVPLTVKYPEYQGETKEDAVDFIVKKFTTAFKGNRLDKNVYVTCGLDRDNVNNIFDSVQRSVLLGNIQESFKM